MFNKNDIYSHIANGGDPEELYRALDREIQTATDRAIKEKDAKLKSAKARIAAVKALKDYFTLVNPNVTESIINSVLNSLETLEIKINGRSTIDTRKKDEFPDIPEEELIAAIRTIFSLPDITF